MDRRLWPQRSLLLGAVCPGTLASRVSVPPGDLVDKPAQLDFADDVPARQAWLTAYQILIAQSGHHSQGTRS